MKIQQLKSQLQVNTAQEKVKVRENERKKKQQHATTVLSDAGTANGSIYTGIQMDPANLRNHIIASSLSGAATYPRHSRRYYDSPPDHYHYDRRSRYESPPRHYSRRYSRSPSYEERSHSCYSRRDDSRSSAARSSKQMVIAVPKKQSAIEKAFLNDNDHDDVISSITQTQAIGTVATVNDEEATKMSPNIFEEENDS